jgi:hypothetical protein
MLCVRIVVAGGGGRGNGGGGGGGGGGTLCMLVMDSVSFGQWRPASHQMHILELIMLDRLHQANKTAPGAETRCCSAVSDWGLLVLTSRQRHSCCCRV